jgi:DNA-binding NarL/FixJ family response regulator
VRVGVALARPDDPQQLLDHALSESFEKGDRGSFVIAFRTFPEILRMTHDHRTYGGRIHQLLSDLDETDLARKIGIDLPQVRLASAEQRLSPRESEVADLLVEGLKNREIAAALFISEVTVKAHLRKVFTKLNVRSRTEAALALQRARIQ